MLKINVQFKIESIKGFITLNKKVTIHPLYNEGTPLKLQHFNFHTKNAI